VLQPVGSMLDAFDRSGRSRRKEREMKGKQHILGSTIALCVVVAAVAAPSGFAAGGTSPDAFERAVNARMNALSSPRQAAPDAFERAVNARMNALSNSRQAPPDAFERALNAHTQALAAGATTFGHRGPDLVERAPVTIGSPTIDPGFDWAAAAVGGSAMLALVLVLSGGAVVTRHARSTVAR
jgi:hypothetical protein